MIKHNTSTTNSRNAASPSTKRRARSVGAVNVLVRRHPFAAPFSDKRRREADCYERREPAPTPSARTVAEIVGSARRKLRHGQRWGDWRLDAHRLTLDYAPDDIWRYELNLEANHDSASILDFVFQFHGKVWATPQTMKGLLDALDDIFDPQANLCSCGRNKRIDHQKLLAERIEPPTEAERAESARAAYQSNAAWLGSEVTDFLVNGSDSKEAR